MLINLSKSTLHRKPHQRLLHRATQKTFSASLLLDYILTSSLSSDFFARNQISAKRISPFLLRKHLARGFENVIFDSDECRFKRVRNWNPSETIRSTHRKWIDLNELGGKSCSMESFVLPSSSEPCRIKIDLEFMPFAKRFAKNINA